MSPFIAYLFIEAGKGDKGSKDLRDLLQVKNLTGMQQESSS